MKKIAILLAAFIGAAGLSACATQSGIPEGAVQLTGPELTALASGNTRELIITPRPGLVITSWSYISPDGNLKVKNSKGETGTAKWAVKDNQFCINWVKPYHEWKVEDFCGSAYKSGDKILQHDGQELVILKGNPKNL